MLRNREIRVLLSTMCTTSLVLLVIASIFSFLAMVFTLITSVVFFVCTIFFTTWRYREIEKLSNYLRQISSGDYTLDVRDNQEGELSILKNDIFKVTIMLLEQSTLLKKEKIHLTDAISDISHQLKTPLTSMMVMADLLSDDHLPPEKRTEFTHNIVIQLERMEWLVSSLLKMSKMDADTVLFKKQQIIVNQLIQKSLEPVLIPIDIKQQTIRIQGEDTVTFLGDVNWTAEAIINILKNAVEHTHEGGMIDISFSENALFTEINIKDNGKGIPKEDLPYIFKRFYKGKGENESSIGIGLAMAHMIITKQNGVIVVRSDQGKGTYFQIKFYK